MAVTSQRLFESHFAVETLRELIDTHLMPGGARGVDGTNYDLFIEKWEQEIDLISSRALSGGYKFSPFRQKLIIKDAHSAPRQVSIPTIRDKVALRALNNFLADCFYTARPQHSHQVISAAIGSARNAMATDQFIKLDIQAFYDEIDHKILMQILRSRIRAKAPLMMIEAAIKTPTGTTVAEAEHNALGVPQGLSISNILASIYLKSIDGKYEATLGLRYHRYVDDILCVTSLTEAKGIAAAISKDLKRKKKLKTHSIGSGKSSITTISESVVYLGYDFCGTSISVRSSTEKKLLSSLMRIINSATNENIERSIWRLNLRLSGCRLNDSNVGWMFYFSQINDKNLLSRVDAQVKKAMVRKFDIATYARCKRLIKSFHEVKYNHRDSNYFHNFDSFERADMISLLKRVFPDRVFNLETKSDADIRRIFNRVITREVREMERDTLGSFS
jgi:RNA-directed DNA polymerase